MKIAVTGGAGFIGSEMTRQLVSQGYDVLVIDSLTYAGNLFNLDSVQAGIEFVRADIRNVKDIQEIFSARKIDAIVNFAAETHVDNSIRQPGVFIETNILGAFNLLEEARKSNTRFVQVSTDEVYGSITRGSFSENDKLDPSSPYSASKASAEFLLQSYVKTYKIEGLIVRCSNNYGPFQHPEKLIPHFISRLSTGSKIPVYGDGKNIREWIHVSDSVRGIITVLNNGKPGEIYNISSGEFRTNTQVAHLILKSMGYDESMIEYVTDRPGHDFRYAVDNAKIFSELGWKSRINFESGLASTIKWYQENPNFLRGK
jgi:dTDP-glucose 4,6-dehydratase